MLLKSLLPIKKQKSFIKQIRIKEKEWQSKQQAQITIFFQKLPDRIYNSIVRESFSNFFFKCKIKINANMLK